MPAPHLVLSNQSSYAPSDVPLDDIAHAISRQLEDFAKAWGEITWTLVDDLRRQGFQVVLFDTSDQAGDLAYHDVTPEGRPYASVFCKTILDNDGTWTKGANSVSAATSHEVVELLADPACNRYALTGNGEEFALETADATENDSYDVGGVSYEASQDVSHLGQHIDLHTSQLGLPASVKYDPHNPGNSIVIAEGWSGLRG